MVLTGRLLPCARCLEWIPTLPRKLGGVGVTSSENRFCWDLHLLWTSSQCELWCVISQSVFGRKRRVCAEKKVPRSLRVEMLQVKVNDITLTVV